MSKSIQEKLNQIENLIAEVMLEVCDIELCDGDCVDLDIDHTPIHAFGRMKPSSWNVSANVRVTNTKVY